MKIIVKRDDELLNYLYNNLDMPKKRIKQYLVHGAVYVNNNKVTQYNYEIHKGMEIIIDTDNKKRSTLAFDIVYEDDEIIVVNKPSGLLTIATDKEKSRTLYHIVREYLVNKNKNNKIFIVHRLDKDTSGIVIFAKNEKIKKKLQENWNEWVRLREYVAVVDGVLEKKEDRIVQRLLETKTNLVYVSKNNEGKEAITNYKVLKENEKYSMLSIKIETGRKNQIRVALASIGHPIVGDSKYKAKNKDKDKSKEKRLYLHCNRVKIYYPVIKKDILFEVSTPNEFKKKVN